ncbi:phosphoadenylyl-sulfate reductase [Thermophagus sp. OGC60D27]|uniref:phosphoadenylyl-sulfate reductase n=1 Tax=Thermophagus sp. OGC60D27 TaxID=3458415 RepID=UPI004037992E
MDKSKLDELNNRFQNQKPEDVIAWFLNEYDNKVALSSSLGAEDQVLTDMVLKIKSDARIFTLDTGRLFPETYDLIDRTNKKYNVKIEVLFPDFKQVEEMVNNKGINLFYESIENRKQCCHIRKIEPLKRVFQTLDAWICGLRAGQAVTRQNIRVVEWDDNNGLIKVNPLAHWSEKEVWDYIKENKVPYNPLHDKGFPSIGCLPCTRAIEPGEDVRAGRWWWENPESKECGLHKR